jgi:metal-dependent amidase/aminoacylase/carboxypeptidase family protein
VLELNDRLSYKSQTAGKCTPAAMTPIPLLTAARALYDIREQLAGNVRLIFQPAEEIAEGAKAMMAGLSIMWTTFSGCISGPASPGKISCNVGSSFASADLLKVTFRGRGGHGSMPEACVDAAVVASCDESAGYRGARNLAAGVRGRAIGKMDVGTL